MDIFSLQNSLYPARQKISINLFLLFLKPLFRDNFPGNGNWVEPSTFGVLLDSDLPSTTMGLKLIII